MTDIGPKRGSSHREELGPELRIKSTLPSGEDGTAWAYDNLGSISPIFYAQLFLEHIPKVKKDIEDLTVFLRFWDLLS